MAAWNAQAAAVQAVLVDPASARRVLSTPHLGQIPLPEFLGSVRPRVPVAPDAEPQTRLLGFIGRDPAWTPLTPGVAGTS